MVAFELRYPVKTCIGLKLMPCSNSCVLKLGRNSCRVNPAKAGFTIVCGLLKSGMSRRFFMGRKQIWVLLR